MPDPSPFQHLADLAISGWRADCWAGQELHDQSELRHPDDC